MCLSIGFLLEANSLKVEAVCSEISIFVTLGCILIEPISLLDKLPALQSIATNHLGSAVSSLPTDSSNHMLFLKPLSLPRTSSRPEGFLKSSGADKSFPRSL